jgi:hypothetical protein
LKAEGIPIQEHLLNILKAVLSTSPLTGPIASLITDYIPSAHFTRLEVFVEVIAQDLERLQNRIETDYITTDEFAFMFENTFRAVAENYQADKLEAFRGILINAAIRREITGEEKEFFLNLAMNLTTIHIRILKFMVTPDEYLAKMGIPREKIQGGFNHFFPIAIPGIQMDVIRSAYADLNRYGLTNTGPEIFGTTTAAQGLELLGGRVTNLGKHFIQFCSIPE